MKNSFREECSALSVKIGLYVGYKGTTIAQLVAACHYGLGITWRNSRRFEIAALLKKENTKTCPEETS